MRKFHHFIVQIALLLSVLLTIAGCSSNPKDAYVYIVNAANNTNINHFHDDYQVDLDLPEIFDLRDFGVVTPVKNQNPWNTCWGFAAITAAETSILTSLGYTYDEFQIDLSEKHLIWFSKSNVINKQDSQYGEGLYYEGNDSFDVGGFTYTATSIFSSGTGVISEVTVPYRGNNGIIADDEENYSKDDDWSVDEQYRYIQEYKLVESNVLSSPAKRDEDGKYLGYSAYAADCIKRELLSGKAVTICYHSEKGNEDGGPKYLNTENNAWTHYTYDDAPYSHSVTIVGYDNTIPKESFLNHENDNDEGNPYLPEGDGAWIVKNSWGAETEEFPNHGVWGIRNQDGKATGYFYLSYYDHSLYGPESFAFEPSIEQNQYIINQYDFLQSKDTKSIYSHDEVKMANVFSNSVDKTLKAVSVETCSEDADVNIKIYLLKDDKYKNPEDGVLMFNDDYHFDYAGYHKIIIDDELLTKAGEFVSIVVTQKISIDNIDYHEIFVDTQQKDDGNGIHAKGIVNKRESFLYIKDNDSWYDWSEIVDIFNEDEQLSEYVYDNFPIKLYSDIIK